MSVHTTARPRNCYSTCGMRVTVEEGKLRRLESHPENRATSAGSASRARAGVEEAPDDSDPSATWLWGLELTRIDREGIEERNPLAVIR